MPGADHKPGMLLLGETDWRDVHKPFGLLRDDRRRHVWVVGKTGSGKSTLLADLVRQDLLAGEGIALFDPHGDLVDQVLSWVPESRTADVLLFAPEDREHPLSWNVFRAGKRPHADPALFASQLLATFRAQWSEFWGPRLEHLLRNGLLAVAAHPQATLLMLYRFFTDPALRERIVARVEDPVVRHFWTTEFPLYGKALQGEALSPVLNKLGAFLANPTVRNLVGQERSRVDLRALIDRRGILLAKLPAGTLGEDVVRLLGGLLLTGLELAAMERRQSEPAVWIVLDEFQHFVNASIPTLLAEARKFGVGLVLAHQYLGQLPETVRSAVRGNVGTTLYFRLGAEDAEALAADVAPELEPGDLERQAQFRMIARLLAKGATLPPFTARTFPPVTRPESAEAVAARIVAASRARYAADRAEVERHIRRTFAPDIDHVPPGEP